jgi:hypothetical protein
MMLSGEAGHLVQMREQECPQVSDMKKRSLPEETWKTAEQRKPGAGWERTTIPLTFHWL